MGGAERIYIINRYEIISFMKFPQLVLVYYVYYDFQTVIMI